MSANRKPKSSKVIDAEIDDIVEAQADQDDARSKPVKRSQSIEEKVARLDGNRLARECAKLDPAGEQALADEGPAAEVTEWVEY